jgi:hypothetical protein
MILMVKYVKKSFNVLKFQHPPLVHDLRFQKEKEKEKTKIGNTHKETRI